MNKKKIIIISSLLFLPLTFHYQKRDLKVSTNNFDKHQYQKKMANLFSKFKFINSAKATSSLAPNSINNIRNSIGLAIGYHDNVAYGELACGGITPPLYSDCNNAPPYNGIVGRLTDIINTLPAIGDAVGIKSCDQVPASGSINGVDADGNSIVISFKTPTHQIPSGWLGSGRTYQKRVEFSQTVVGDPTRIAYEFDCGDSGTSYVAITMDMGTRGGLNYERRITVYNGPINADKKGIEVYMAEINPAQARSRAIDAIRIEYLPSSLEFNLWGIMNTNISGGQLVTRSVIHGNYNTGLASVLYSGYQGATLQGNDEAIDSSQFQGAFAQSTGLTNGSNNSADYNFAFDLSNHSGEVYKKGCINFTTPNSEPNNSNECASLPLVAPSSAPFVDSNGSFSLEWAINTMPSKLEVVN